MDGGDDETAPGADQSDRDVTSTAPSGSSGGSVTEGGTADVHSYIGGRLRQAFDDIAKQPVPDRFLQLMAELDRS